MVTPTNLRIVAATALVSPGFGNDLDDTWQRFLDTPPQVSVELGASLSERADEISAALAPQKLAVSGDFDISISGGGFFDSYYLGTQMVLNRVKDLTLHRYTGASAGGMMPFEFLLKGENATLLTHLAYGELTLEFANKFSNALSCSLHSDHHWRMLASWQTQKYADLLPSLNDRAFLALSCLSPLPTLVIVSNFTAEEDQATKAFMATGTVEETYKGKICSDGGSMSGPNMTPLFQDQVRPQLIVDLMSTGQESECLSCVRTEKYAAGIRRGQDEAAEFLKTGMVSRDAKAITLCPLGADVHKNVCKQAVQV